MKKILIILVSIILIVFIGLAVLYKFRQDVAQYSAESIVMKNLPDYIKIDNLIFDIDEKMLKIEGFALKNPPGYEKKYMAEIKTIICRYEMKSKNIFDGIAVTEIRAEEPVIFIERMPDGRMNVNEMEAVLTGGTSTQGNAEEVPPGDIKGPASEEVFSRNEIAEKNSSHLSEFAKGKFNIADWVDLTDIVDIYNGKLFIVDRVISSPPYKITFEDINGIIRIILNADYTEVISVESTGTGQVNGDRMQTINWKISLDPRKKDLTMSNDVEVENLDITLFEPYYYNYSPIEIYKGSCSGSLVFNFNDGNIGSSNTLRLKNFKFSLKKNAIGEKYWHVAIGDIIKYLQSASGEVIFDFKIKGPMDSPRFYPGPYVNKALKSMVVDKLAEVIQGLDPDSENKQAPGESTGAEPDNREKSDTEMVLDVLKGLLD